MKEILIKSNAKTIINIGKASSKMKDLRSLRITLKRLRKVALQCKKKIDEDESILGMLSESNYVLSSLSSFYCGFLTLSIESISPFPVSLTVFSLIEIS